VAYCTRDDLLGQIDEAGLVQLTEDGDSGLEVTDGGGLDADYSAGWCRVGGTKFELVAGSVACADDALNFVYVDADGAVQVGIALPDGASYALALVQTAGGAIVLINDLRQASDSDALLAAIADADSEIDGYLGRRLSVPMTTVPPTVRRWSVVITLYNLHLRRGGNMVPEHPRRLAYRDAVASLKEFAAGRLSLGQDDPESTPSEANAPQFTSAPQVMSRDKLGGF
jgi:phage gp36-like protein